MSDINQVVISGRLTRAPELRKTPSNVPVCDLSIACNRDVKVGEKFQQFPTFLKVTQWNKRAEKAAELYKLGDEVLVTGQLVDDNFERDDGSQTSGRLKIDNANIRLLRKYTGTKTDKNTPVIGE